MTARPGQRISLGWSRENLVALTALLCAWGLYLGFRAAGPGEFLGRSPAVHADKVALVREKIDPNTATAASMRRLPLIGLERAEAIVAYRKAQQEGGRRAFEHLEDLAGVPGIGPGVLRRVGEHLSLTPRQADGTWPSGPVNASGKERLNELGATLQNWGRNGGGTAPEVIPPRDGGGTEPPPPKPPGRPPS